ncbi:uncharacterized protein LAESUDRAFT_643350 [Laetiporus sulphureus 93-53]|uniref:Muskelin N-terminal domain-containing protein n=1 Tax=Laetiporus sulphureus 93-53 TaxID=1314785 RepID=A0A165GVK7_9APHY|nr:uncharacterized protein LAESUDRAFT_643350 [Laetiporus sulphureus 93-53]KZT10880.1 hypothetical protein LAESUDRAFT_643350 [Laetiporus sulphureus 93-53]
MTLKYSIAGCSEHSGRYIAENILEDKPMDQTSRWSGAHQSPNVTQWVLLRLDDLAVLKSITFGKFYKPHPCNMKEFKVYVGLSEENMTEVLRAALKNDSTSETFSIRYTNNAGVCFPTRFVKIVPLTVHAQSFHTSIWHVSVSGIIDQPFVQQICARYDEYREASMLRHVLKHLRQRRFLTPFHDILDRSSVQLEHPLISTLYDSLVLNGDWSATERIVHSLSSSGLLDSYRYACQPRAHWTRLHGLDADGDVPSRRSGHAMCMDEKNGLIYLLGGWEGQRSLDDFWMYNVHEDTWRLLSIATSRDRNGPGPRSCHKMVFDAKTGCIYVLGRLGDGDALEPAEAPPEGTDTLPSSPTQREATAAAAEDSRHAADTPMPWSPRSSEFYRYHTRGLDAGRWDLLSLDTVTAGGPCLIFDHQMVMDSEAQVIYVFGGRVVDGAWKAPKYSGFYAYDIRTGCWEMLPVSDASGVQPFIPLRYGHSMLLEPKTHTLFIFAGQRDERYLSDMYAYHIPSRTVTELFPNFTAAGGPEASFTQRAVIDPDLREIYVFCGLTRSPSTRTVLETEAPNWIYRYDHPGRPGKWKEILSTDSTPTSGYRLHDTNAEMPQSRYAHQVVYDTGSKVIYMHGGNAGLAPEGDGNESAIDIGDERGLPLEGPRAEKEIRLDDLWKMTLERPPLDDIVRRATYTIRQQRCRELCEDVSTVRALAFLQSEVASVVNQNDPEEAQLFRSLLAHLLTAPPQLEPSNGTKASGAEPESDVPSEPLPEQEEDEEMEDATGHEEDVGGKSKSAGPIIRLDKDPMEKASDGRSPPSAVRFKQRTEVFEKLLIFVNEDAKQPDANLLDMVHIDVKE